MGFKPLTPEEAAKYKRNVVTRALSGKPHLVRSAEGVSVSSGSRSAAADALRRTGPMLAVFPADVVADARRDPASHAVMLDQAHACIRELLTMIDGLKALHREQCEWLLWTNTDECNDAREWWSGLDRAAKWLEENPS
jgi:hypothetical protein